MTKKSFLEKIPVYSTDSSSWQAIFRFGKSVTSDKKGLMGDFFRNQMRREYKLNKYNCLEEIKRWSKLGEYFTDLWVSRGVDWHGKLEENSI